MDGIIIGFLGTMNGLLLGILICLVTGTVKLKVEHVFPTIKLETVKIVTETRRYPIVSKRLDDIPTKRVTRYTELWRKAGWQVSSVDYGHNSDICNVIVSRYENGN